ncbi:cytidylate kinase-like family protein [bacterium]|nr:cytidylate kinase-like family protein [bacterium]
MATQVVCISRTQAALGEAVGNLVAERLGFRYVDEEVIQQAARLAQVDPALVAAVEQRQPLLRRVIDKLAAARDLIGPATLMVGVPIRTGAADNAARRVTPEDLRVLIQAAIQQLASDGRAVILAHAASMTLATRADVLRVLVTASAETRARRLASAQGMTAEAASAAVAASDRERRDYFLRFHGLADELPTHYDIVVNTDALTPAQAATLIASAALAAR